jgi:hypothetical protein
MRRLPAFISSLLCFFFENSARARAVAVFVCSRGQALLACAGPSLTAARRPRLPALLPPTAITTTRPLPPPIYLVAQH